MKFERAGGSVYAVMWLRKSTQAVVGMALPEGTELGSLHDAPKGMAYPGRIRYITVQDGDEISGDLAG